MPLLAGASFGPYRVVSFIGAGGMGEIYKARDTRLDRTVALKILPQKNDPERKQRFEREARAISQLQHPHICTLFDVGSQDGVEYLVMEFLEGETLAQRLEKGPILFPDLLRYAAEIAAALDHAHCSAICHRDLKPANIMLTKTGVKLLDFGLARALGGEGPPVGGETATMALTREGAILGTLPYMSPEQLEGRPGDARTDIFAFGAVLYEMATGRRAFAGSSGASLITQIMSSDPPPMCEVQPLTPIALERIVRRCLAKNPEERWQSARDIGAALEWVSDQPQATTVKQRRGWLPSALLAAAIIATLALGAAYFWRRAPENPAVTFTISPPPNAEFSNINVPAISPDSKRIAFIATGGGAAQIWIRSLDAIEPRPLAGTEGARAVYWSPDGKHIAFYAANKLKRIPADGGPVQNICNASNIRGMTWNRNGVIIFAPTPLSRLFQVPASGGTPTPLTALDSSRSENSHRWPQFLPDGNHFLYFVRTANAEEWGIYAGSLDSDKSQRKLILKTRSNAAYVPGSSGGAGRLLYVQERTLLAQPFDPDRLQFTGDPVSIADGVAESGPQIAAQFAAAPSLLIHGGGHGGAAQLTWFDRSGKRLSKIESSGISYSRPTLSPDGKHAVVTALDERTVTWDLVLLDIDRDVPTRFTFGGIINQGAVWSPDGRYLGFISIAKGQPAIVKKLIDGSGPEEVLSPLLGQATTACDWSHDGKWILLQRPAESTLSDLLLIPTIPGAKAVPFLETSANETCGQFSPDGKWVAYASDESGRFEVYVQAFPSGGKWQISKQGGMQPRWRADSRELFYRSGAADDYMTAVDVRAGTSLEIGTPKKLFSAQPVGLLLGAVIDYAVTADGQKFLIPAESDSSVNQPMTAVLNWTSLLTK